MRTVIPLTSRVPAHSAVLHATPNTRSAEYDAHVAACTWCDEYNHALVAAVSEPRI